MLRRLIARASQTAVAWSILVAALRIAGLIVCMPLTVRCLSPEELGLWQLFIAYAGLSAFIDIGFGPACERAVSFAWGGASQLKALGHDHSENEPAKENRPPNYQLLADLIRTISVYYWILAGGTLILACSLSFPEIWKKTEALSTANQLRAAGVFYIVSLSLGCVTYYWNLCLMGINGVRQAQITMLWGLVWNYLLLAGGLLLGWGLWAPVLGQVSMMVWNRFQSKRYFLALAGSTYKLAHRSALARMEIMITLWPIAWRTGLTTFGSYFINQGVLIEASMLGLGLAALGSYGITRQAVSVIAQLSSAWINVKAPLIYQLRTQNRCDEIWNIFLPRLKLMWLTWIIISLILLFAGPWVFTQIGSKTPLLPSSMIVFLCIMGILELNHQAFAILIYSENQNPFAWLTLATAGSVLLLGYFLIPSHHVWGLLLAQGISLAGIANWWIPWRALRGLKSGIVPRQGHTEIAR